MVRIDQCWNGKASPISVTQGGITVAIGLDMDATGWIAPTDNVCDALERKLNTAFAATWTVGRASATGKITFASDALFDITFQPGFAVWAGFTSTTYSGVDIILSESTPPHFSQCYAGYSLPIRYWTRNTSAVRKAVVWDSHWSWEITLTRDGKDDLDDLIRTPFCLVGSDLTDWSPSNRDGYLALRPSWEGVQREQKGTGTTYGTFFFRAEWLNTSL